MNKATKIVTFTVHCSSLLEAATLEETLNKMGLTEFSYIAIDGKSRNSHILYPTNKQKGKGMGRKHYPVTDEVRAKIRATAKAHPKATIERLQKLSGLPHSQSTFCRVLGKM